MTVFGPEYCTGAVLESGRWTLSQCRLRVPGSWVCGWALARSRFRLGDLCEPSYSCAASGWALADGVSGWEISVSPATVVLRAAGLLPLAFQVGRSP
jgi:hypothetical protein